MGVQRPSSIIVLLLLLLWATTVHAQAVRKKHLLMSLGGGIGVLNLFSDREDIEVVGLGSGAVRAAFGYATGDRWSFGLHYDRVGSTGHNGGLDRLHLTTYMLGVAYRPWISARSAMELELAIGTSATSLFALETRLPYTSTGGVIGLSYRYLGMLSRTLGAFVALDHTASSSDELLLEGGQVNPDGRPSRLQWNSQRITCGLVVRF